MGMTQFLLAYRRGCFLGKSQSRAPSPAKPLYHSFYSPNGGASLIKGYDLHGYRRGGTFDSPKVPKSDLGLRPENPVALLRWIRIYF